VEEETIKKAYTQVLQAQVHSLEDSTFFSLEEITKV
jgi:hypothetical protein